MTEVDLRIRPRIRTAVHNMAPFQEHHRRGSVRILTISRNFWLASKGACFPAASTAKVVDLHYWKTKAPQKDVIQEPDYHSDSPYSDSRPKRRLRSRPFYYFHAASSQMVALLQHSDQCTDAATTQSHCVGDKGAMNQKSIALSTSEFASHGTIMLN